MLSKALVLLSVFSAAFAATINTPMGITACQPILISWTDTANAGPYYVAVIPGGQPSGVPLHQFPATTQSQITWTVDIPAGTSISLSLTDATGAVAYSDQVTIGQGVGTCDAGAAEAAAATTTAAARATGAARAAAASSAADEADENVAELSVVPKQHDV